MSSKRSKRLARVLLLRRARLICESEMPVPVLLVYSLILTLSYPIQDSRHVGLYPDWRLQLELFWMCLLMRGANAPPVLPYLFPAIINSSLSFLPLSAFVYD